MSPEQSEFLNLRFPPAFYTKAHVCWTLNINEHEFDALLRARLLRPVGAAPPINSPKFFVGFEIRSLANDPTWLHKARSAIVKHWARRNSQANGQTPKAKSRRSDADLELVEAN